jgi:hypothetical protein
MTRWMKPLLPAFLIGSAIGPVAAPRPAAADGGWVHGCWYSPPRPPACDSCADNCNPGQKCCIILHM